MEREQRPTTEKVVQAVIGPEQIKKFTQVLEEYKSGKSRTEQRILASENWWKLRNTTEEQRETNIGKDGGYKSVSGWLHNVIVSKHADAMDAYPEPNILPREEGDKGEARMLSAIIPCILEQNRFENTYSDAMWQKIKAGTGVYKVIWDKSKLNGLGDIAIRKVDIINLFLPKGVKVLYTKGKQASMNHEYSTTTDPIAPDMPLVVLVNGMSASSSEILN